MQHPLSYVNPDAQIGKDVEIGPFVTIEGARIGKNCTIFPGAVVSAIPQDLKFKGEETTAEIGDNTTLREYVTVNRGTASKGKTVIGNNCLLMAYVHISHDCKLGNNIIISNASQIAGEVVIDDFAILSGGVLCHQFSHIGSHVMIQGGSQINKDIPPPIAFAGINTVGLRRRNFSDEAVALIQEVYRCIYMAGMNTSDALKYIEDNIPATPERDEIVRFVRNSERGIVRGIK